MDEIQTIYICFNLILFTIVKIEDWHALETISHFLLSYNDVASF